MLNRRQLLAATGSGLALAGGFPLKAWAQTGRKAYSLHVGVNRADQGAYPGGISQLAGCINDAKAYRKMASQAGFKENRSLHDSQATIREVSRHIYHAADSLNSGDIFFVSYAGHGTGVDDRSGDEQDDRQDEAWCLHDGLLLDDYLYALWSRFKPGVRLLVVSDSCHSGTVARVRAAARALATDLASGNQSRTRGMLGDNARGADDVNAYATRLARGGDVARVSQASVFRPRTISPEQAAQAYNEKQEDYLEQERKAGGATGSADVRASGILLAGCQDHELSWESSAGGPGGLFTRQMQSAFNERTNIFGYSLFKNHVAAQMPSYQNPNLFLFGEDHDDFLNQTPFTV